MSIFSKVKVRRPSQSKFNLSHERKMSMKMGELTPVLVQEILPGDAFRVNTEVFMRMAPMLAPIMHRVNVKMEYFFVPNRLVWDEWEEFITGGREGTETPPVPPHVSTANVHAAGVHAVGSLWDFFGLPPGFGAPAVSLDISAMQFRAYQLIYDEYYRDQNLSPSLDIDKGSGAINGAELTKILTIRNRAWEKDYFTSALPWAQRGPEALMPIEGEGSVTYKPISDVFEVTGDFPQSTSNLGVQINDPELDVNTGTGIKGRIENIDEVNVDASSVTINDLRRSISLQKWLEKMARGGARYIEQTLMQWGVKSSDARLQRPEYLGGSTNPIRISEVLSTFQDATGEPQGNMAGHGVAAAGRNGFKRRFEEHGYVIGIMSVLPRTAYQQGIHRQWTRFDKLDFAWPDFAHLGEQEILSRELFYGGGAATPNATFGYTPRYAEYKYGCSSVHGEFRNSLSFWHMGRIFSAAPVLNEDFITADPTTRIFAVESQNEHLYCQVYNRIDALRRLPYYGTPSL